MDMSDTYLKVLSGKPEQSIYRNLGMHVDQGWPTMVQFEGKIFANTYSIDKYIYLRDVEEDEIIGILEIPEEYQPLYDAVPFDSNDKPDRQRINSRIFSDGNRIIIESLNRIPAQELRVIQQIPNWRESDEYKMAFRKYVSRTFLVFDKDGYLGELELDLGGINYDIISSEAGFFWVQRRYEDERDYRTFLKIRIAEVK